MGDQASNPVEIPLRNTQTKRPPTSFYPQIQERFMEQKSMKKLTHLHFRYRNSKDGELEDKVAKLH